MSAQAVASDLKYRASWLLLGWLMIAFVVYLSLTPKAPPPFLRFASADKLGHLLAYAILMGWFCQLFWQSNQRVMLGVAFAAMGIALEFIQAMTGYRYFAYSDMIANVLGVGIGRALMATRLRESVAALDRLAGIVAQR